MKKIIFKLAVALLVFSLAVIGCDSGGSHGSGSSGGDVNGDKVSVYSGEDLSVTREGEFTFENILSYEDLDPKEAKKTVYFFSDDTGWCSGQGIKYELQEGSLKLDFKKIQGLESGVIRFKLKYSVPEAGKKFIDPADLSEKDREMFVRKTGSGSTYGAGELVLAVLWSDGSFSPVPTNQEAYGRDRINWPIESRNHDRSPCLVNGGDDNEDEEPIDCVSVSIDEDNQILCLENIYQGFETPDNARGEIMAVSDQTSWSYLDGVPVIVTDGCGKLDLSQLMFAEGATRFNLIMDINGENYWFISSKLCPDAQDLLLRETLSSGDTVMALEDITSPVAGDTVRVRDRDGDYPESACVSVSIDADNQVLCLKNIYQGFETPDDARGEIMAVSDKTGWNYLDGVPVTVTDGCGKLDLSQLMFADGATRFNFIMDINGENYWFISSQLCPEAQDLLWRKTKDSGDTVMALEDMVCPVEGEVEER